MACFAVLLTSTRYEIFSSDFLVRAAAHRVVSAILLRGTADRDVGAQLEVYLRRGRAAFCKIPGRHGSQRGALRSKRRSSTAIVPAPFIRDRKSTRLNSSHLG